MASENRSLPRTANSDANEESLAKHQTFIGDENRKPNGYHTSKNHASGAVSPLANGTEAAHKTINSRQTPVIDITKDLSALISQQMRATPDAVALEDETTTLTYRELDEKVTVLAHRLRDHGVGRDNLVGVLLGRSANYVIACLAALRAGGAFLVLELAYPPNLLADVIEDAKPTVVITNTTQANQVNANIPLIILHENGVGSYKPTESVKEHSPLPSDDDLERLAFVSYSSGTTGRPVSFTIPIHSHFLSPTLRY